MTHLTLNLLGGFEAAIDAEPITTFGADKVRALLAFLAIESSRPHRRAKLSGMFWPDLPEKKAAHNLSQSLLRLRKVLQEKKASTDSSFLVVTPQNIQFNTYSSYQLDVLHFHELLTLCHQHHHSEAANCDVCAQWRSQAAELYQGDLLAGFFIPDSVAFEEWRLVQQEALHRQALETLDWLAVYHEQRGEFDRVQAYARRQTALEPWREEAHVQLMRALAQSGQPAAALRQYEQYQEILAEELGIKPGVEASALYSQILSGELVQPAAPPPDAREAVWLSSQGERRQITTLACSRNIQAESEELGEQTTSCERHCESVFHRFGGQRAPRQGSACLVYFGYPQAYEDAARRAVHAGLEVAAALDGNESVRIGIHTGIMAVGKMRGPRWQDRDLTGSAFETARDCQRQAGPGEVVISEDTRRLVQESFDLRPLVPQTAGASKQPLQVYQVAGERSRQSRLDWLAQTQRLTTFTGRVEEMTRLRASLDKVLQGTGQAVFLSGEPGIGKSRLIWELKKSAPTIGTLTSGTQSNQPPVCWLSSRCLPHYQNSSLYPVIELLEQLLGFQADDSIEIRQEKLTGMLAWYGLDRPSTLWLLSLLLGLPTGAPTPETITKAQREQMRALFIELLQKRAAEQPLVLVVEDLQWSDPSTIDWLGQSIDGLADAPCLTLLTARPDFNPIWLSHQDLRPNLHLLTLDPLRPEQAEQMVMNLAGENMLAEEIRSHITAKTDGIPLFVEELTKTLLEHSAFEGKANQTAKIPVTLLDSLAARLDRQGTAKETAQWAAVIGREFSYPILQACTAYDEQRLQNDLAHLIEAELVSPLGDTPLNGPARYTFRHALMQEAAYTSLLKRTRQLYHRHIAEMLETRFPQIAETRPELLAQHYANADLPTQAADFWLQAGKQATVQGATLEARTFFDRVIEWIEPEDSERRWQALLGRETALFFRGERAAQKADVDALLELAEITNDDTRRAQAQTRLARYASSQADYREQLAAAEAAVTAARRAGDLTIEVESLAYKVTALMRLGERAAVQQAVERTLAQAQKVGDDHIRAYAMAAIALYYLEDGDLARAARFLNRSLEAAGRTPTRHLDLESHYQGHLGFTYAQLGLYTQAREALEAGLKLADLMGIGRFQAYHMLNLGFVNWRTGDLETAVQMEEDALREYLATGETFGQAAGRAYLGYIYEEMGDPARAAKYLAESRAGFAEIGVDADKFEAQAVEARVALSQGRHEQARQLVREVWHYLGERGTEGLSSPGWIFLCVADVLEEIDVPDISLRDVITTGYGKLMESAEKISDDDWRRSFLENVVENRAIVERWERVVNEATAVPNLPCF